MAEQAPRGLKDDYGDLAAVLADMANAAQQGDAERLLALQTPYENLIAHLQAHPARLAQREDAPLIAQQIRDALAAIEHTVPQIQAIQERLRSEATDTRMHRKVSESYR
ncbi:hypothetical protein G3580_06470 [Nitrogeniibacter mangrovi]|uniref:Flagellar protein FliT n=1 Tax=Nitrogeniibacter mangrovi TaxID=2016596 RepID=A0A6C1B4W0_9RHOO|nr:flagellar protein FliT [Nitrogeniibacter mangrovi]QID17320.1 hypothetical protein G3580_06470 [Nitrogeniibacter mangrovi]